MKAATYNGPQDVAVSDVPDPQIERPGDSIVQITRTNICGSDLHMYERRIDMEPGRVLGHENIAAVRVPMTRRTTRRAASTRTPPSTAWSAPSGSPEGSAWWGSTYPVTRARVPT
jgi:hypothetical protein